MIEFDLPRKLIAQEPAQPRDSARLLVYERRTGQLTDSRFSLLDAFLPKDATLVVNDSRVERCRWLFPHNKEVFVLNKLVTHTITAMVRPGRKFRLGHIVDLDDEISAEVVSIDKEGLRTLKLNVKHDDPQLAKYEHIPLPPYIAQNDNLAADYQTVYANPLGSKAAPTAGLHFTEDLLTSLSKSHDIAKITLHVGLGTFQTPSESQIRQKSLHEEYYEIDAAAIAKLGKATHLTAVGTTTVRTLETMARQGGLTLPARGFTDIFIQPGDEFLAVDSMITNFHLPGTSLLMLVAAFIGSEDELLKIYQHAIKQRYRFYSFGDAMLIL